jgi:hypothetical protein
LNAQTTTEGAMAEPIGIDDIEDVVSSVRRLVSHEARSRPVSRNQALDRLLLTPALRVVSDEPPEAVPDLNQGWVDLEAGAAAEPLASGALAEVYVLSNDVVPGTEDSSTQVVEGEWGQSFWSESEPPLAEIALVAEDAELVTSDAQPADELNTAPWAQEDAGWLEAEPSTEAGLASAEEPQLEAVSSLVEEPEVVLARLHESERAQVLETDVESLPEPEGLSVPEQERELEPVSALVEEPEVVLVRLNEPEPVLGSDTESMPEPERLSVPEQEREPEPLSALVEEPEVILARLNEPEPAQVLESDVESLPEPERLSVPEQEREPEPLSALVEEPEVVLARLNEPEPAQVFESGMESSPQPESLSVPVTVPEPELEPVSALAIESEPVQALAQELSPASALEPEAEPLPQPDIVAQPLQSEGAAVPGSAEVVPGLTDADGNPITVLDEAALNEMVRALIREELQGALGERITHNVRKLVRAEINRALTARALD